MKKQISIQNPCHMNWKNLDTIQNSKNRHCRECSIDIIDFTQMNNDEIIKYISERKTEKICAKIYSVDKNSRYSKVQEHILNLHERIKSNVNNRLLKTTILGILGLMLTTTGCIGKPNRDSDPCPVKLVPDTTTQAPNDSIYVDDCN